MSIFLHDRGVWGHDVGIFLHDGGVLRFDRAILESDASIWRGDAGVWRGDGFVWLGYGLIFWRFCFVHSWGVGGLAEGGGRGTKRLDPGRLDERNLSEISLGQFAVRATVSPL